MPTTPLESPCSSKCQLVNIYSYVKKGDFLPNCTRLKEDKMC